MKQLSPMDQKSWDQEIVHRLSALIRQITNTKLIGNEQINWGIYRTLGDEPNLEGLWDDKSLNVGWCFPRVKDKTSMGFIRVKDPSSKTSWAQGPFKNLQEPSLTFSQDQSVTEVNVNQLKGCIIPALAYDEKGYRLGRGQGYYDRALENFIGIKVGVIYSMQLLKKELPIEGHDICVDYILTERQLIPIQKKD